MKVAQVTATFPPYRGGMGAVAQFFAALTSRFAACDVLVPAYRGQPDAPEDETTRYRVRRLQPLFQYGNAALLPSLRRELGRYDVVHLHYPFYGGAEFAVLARLTGRCRRLVLHYHMDTVGSGWKGLVFKLYGRGFTPLALAKADVITVASVDYTRSSGIGPYFSRHPGKFREIPFGVDLDLYHPAPRSPRASGRILFVGGLDRAHYFKGVDVLLRALARLPDAELSLVGEGDLRPEYERTAVALGLAGRVHFLGSLGDEEKAKQLRDADVLALPSIDRSEAFGLVLLEAMASGTPVVASSLPGVRQVFQNGEEGFLCTPGDDVALADALGRVLGDPILARRMGEAGVRRVQERYSCERVGEALRQIYEALWHDSQTR